MQRSRKQKTQASKDQAHAHAQEAIFSKPVSGKQKKELMKQQKERNRQKALQRAQEDEEEDRQRLASYGLDHSTRGLAHSEPISPPPPNDAIPDFSTISTTDLRTVFLRESDEQVEQRKRDSRIPYTRVPLGPLDLPSDEMGYCTQVIDIPHRPPWTRDMTKAELDRSEHSYFVDYLTQLYSCYNRSRLNTFEHNLEVWRQLWRVCERSDILLVLADSRHPLFNFPSSLYRYVTDQLQKPMVLVLTKTDLVPERVLQAWTAWFREHYPSLYVVQFSCCPATNEVEAEDASAKRRNAKKREQLLKSSRVREALGREQLLEVLRLIVREHYERIYATDDAKRHFSLDSTHYQRNATGDALETKHDEASAPGEFEDDQAADESDNDGIEQLEEEDDAFPERDNDRLVQPFITLGTIGHPNAGKSSMINALIGKKVVSVSRTPGHTKHLQTIFLNPFTRLCDCPGLVFPALDMPLALQILCGLINTAQVREPYTTIAFAAARIPLEKIYKLPLPPDSDDHDTTCTVDTYPWSGWTIAEAWAIKRGYLTQKGAPDRHRAGNEILRDLHEGRVVLALAPPIS